MLNKGTSSSASEAVYKMQTDYETELWWCSYESTVIDPRSLRMLREGEPASVSAGFIRGIFTRLPIRSARCRSPTSESRSASQPETYDSLRDHVCDTRHVNSAPETALHRVPVGANM